jgi:hypothetical protein
VTGNYNNASGTVHDSIGYGACSVGAGGVILPPINSDGTSVYNRKGGSTIAVKFNVCGANDAPLTRSIEMPGVVSGFDLTEIISGTLTTAVSELPDSTTPHAAFRSDPAGQQWISNTATGAGTNLNLKSVTYFFQIVLIDGTIIASSGTGGLIPSAPFAGQKVPTITQRDEKIAIFLKLFTARLGVKRKSDARSWRR